MNHHIKQARPFGGRIMALLSIVILVAGCATSREEDRHSAAYPPWLIAAAEPVAPVIGFVASRVEWRPGYLSGDAAALQYVGDRLKPLDIILFSNKHRLSGRAGGGLFGHSAVYLGSERELRRLGMWDDPAVVPFRPQIRKGMVIIESAQRRGVALSPLSQVVETDRLIVVRPQVAGDRERRKAIGVLFARIGARFDHHFRLEETERVFCTELIDQAIPQLRLPQRTLYGRRVILPDDIAARAASGQGKLCFVTYLAADRNGWKVLAAADALADIGRKVDR